MTFPLLWSTYLDQIVSWILCLFLQSSKCGLKHSPGCWLPGSCFSHDHHRVPRVLGLIQLDDLCNSVVCHLQVCPAELRLNGSEHLQCTVKISVTTTGQGINCPLLHSLLRCALWPGDLALQKNAIFIYLYMNGCCCTLKCGISRPCEHLSTPDLRLSCTCTSVVRVKTFLVFFLRTSVALVRVQCMHARTLVFLHTEGSTLASALIHSLLLALSTTELMQQRVTGIMTCKEHWVQSVCLTLHAFLCERVRLLISRF